MYVCTIEIFSVCSNSRAVRSRTYIFDSPGSFPENGGIGAEVGVGGFRKRGGLGEREGGRDGMMKVS